MVFYDNKTRMALILELLFVVLYFLSLFAGCYTEENVGGKKLSFFRLPRLSTNSFLVCVGRRNTVPSRPAVFVIDRSRQDLPIVSCIKGRFNDMAVARRIHLSIHDNNNKNPIIKDCLSAAYRQATFRRGHTVWILRFVAQVESPRRSNNVTSRAMRINIF